jgi:hypothetical protein
VTLSYEVSVFVEKNRSDLVVNETEVLTLIGEFEAFGFVDERAVLGPALSR